MPSASFEHAHVMDGMKCTNLMDTVGTVDCISYVALIKSLDESEHRPE